VDFGENIVDFGETIVDFGENIVNFGENIVDFGEYIKNIPRTNLMERSKSSSLKKPSVKFENLEN